MRRIRYAFRTLFSSPFVTIVAILSLALGIGANAAIFSMFEQILLQPLPVHEPHRLVNLAAPGPKSGSTSCNQAGDCDVIFSYPMFRDLEKAETALSGLAAHRLFGVNIAYDGQTTNAEGVLVSGSYFPLLGIQAARGRLLGPADDETIGGHYVAVLSHHYWETRLGSDPNVIDRTITVNGRPMTIVGIAPRGFYGTTFGPRPAVFVPITMRGEMNPGSAGFDNRRSYWVYVFGRLKPGATVEQAQLSLNAAYGPIIEEIEVPIQDGMSDQMMAQFRAKRVAVEDGRRGQSSTHGEARTPLLLLFATTGIVLLIACANIANLLLARGANRGLEMAVRLSLGAGRRHVLGQLLTESMLLALLGGVASLVVAHWTLAGIGTLLPPEAVDSLALRVSLPTAGFALALAAVTGILFGLFPALHSTRPDLIGTIRANAGNITVTRGATRFRAALVTSQIALSMTMLVVAALFIRSLVNVGRVDLGLQPENVVTFSVSPQLNGYEPERSLIFFARLEEEMAALPGVTSVTASLVPILSGSNWGSNVTVEGFPNDPDTDTNSRFNEVGPAYFATLGIQLLAGREFTTGDDAGAPLVAIVNETFAAKFNLGRDAVGKRMARGSSSDLDIEIVGLVRDAKYSQVKDEIPPLFFTPWRQDQRTGSMSFYVKTATDPAQVMRAVRGVVASLDPNLPVVELKTLPQQVRENVFLDRMIGTLATTFAVLATLLAAIGLYGVLAYTVAQRTREIGVRMALGADRANVRRMVLRQVGIVLIIGGVIGIAAAIALGRAAASLLYGIAGSDPIAIAGAAAVLTLFALAAGFIPAHRAASVDPLRALRYE